MKLCMDEYGIFPLMKVPRGMSDAVASRPESGSFFFPVFHWPGGLGASVASFAVEDLETPKVLEGVEASGRGRGPNHW